MHKHFPGKREALKLLVAASTEGRGTGRQRITESQNVRGWKGPLWVTQSRLHSTVSRRVLNISREGDPTTSLGSLCQGSVTLRGKKFFLGFSWSFLCFSLSLIEESPTPVTFWARRSSCLFDAVSEDQIPAPQLTMATRTALSGSGFLQPDPCPLPGTGNSA